MLANALDFDDGHRLVKGHPGANVIPAALALAEAAGATVEDLLTAVIVGYEIAVRAGLQLHERSSDYHGSGAWGGIGAAAAGARLLGLNAHETANALGVAEYHAPIALTMRSVADPAMTKDACGWGALVGVSSALLAERGFTATSSCLFQAAETSTDLGERWRVLDLYVKKFPCCRWSHPAIEAALTLRGSALFEPEQIASIRVSTFAAAAALARRLPTTTEEAQYSLVWPVAVAFAYGEFDVDHVLEASFGDGLARELAARIEIAVDPALDSAFPGRRLAQVTVETAAGASHRSSLTESPGEPEDPNWSSIVEAKLDRFAPEAGDRPVRLDAPLSRRGSDGLLALLRLALAPA